MRDFVRRVRKSIFRENRIYILPTGFGVAFFALIGVLVLTAATYNNNLVFILTFLLFAAFAVAMVQTHNNLKGVSVDYSQAEENFENRETKLWFRLRRANTQIKRRLRLRIVSKDFLQSQDEPHNMLGGEIQKSVSVRFQPKSWGVFPLPELILETSYPFGLFRTWTVVRPQGEFVVFPRPEGRLADGLALTGISTRDLTGQRSPEGDFGELKEYAEGESYRHISWKHYARTQELYSKVYWGEHRRHHVIPWLGEISDANLRQMSQWIQQALNEDATFEMETPTEKIGSGEGLDHARLSWKTLGRLRRWT